jgi:hypothetical protein
MFDWSAYPQLISFYRTSENTNIALSNKNIQIPILKALAVIPGSGFGGGLNLIIIWQAINL